MSSQDSGAFAIFCEQQRKNVIYKLYRFDYDLLCNGEEVRVRKELEKMWKALSEKEKTTFRRMAEEKIFDYTKFVPKNYIPWDGIIRTMYEDYPISEIPEHIQEYRMRLMPLEEASTTAELFRALDEAKFTQEDFDKIASNTLDWIRSARKREYPNTSLYRLTEDVTNQNRLLFMLRFFNECTIKTNAEVGFLQKFIIQAIQYDRKLTDTLSRCYGRTNEKTTIFEFECIPYFVRKNDTDTVQYLLNHNLKMKAVFYSVFEIEITPEMWTVLLSADLDENDIYNILSRTRDEFIRINPTFIENVNIFTNWTKIHKKYQGALSRFLNDNMRESLTARNSIVKNNLIQDYCFDFSKLWQISFLADRPLQVEKDGKKYEIKLVEKN